MQKRPEPLECPDLPHYCMLTVSTGEHAFRVPSGPKAARVLASISVEGLGGLLSLGEAQDQLQLLAAVRLLGGDTLAALGALIGLGWHHTTRELETPASRDVILYGEAVWEELEDAGYPWADIALLGITLLHLSQQRVSIDAEAVKRLDFFGVQTVAPS